MRGLGALWLNSQPLNIFKQPAELQAGSLETEAGLQRVFLGSGYRKNSPSPREGKEQRRPLLWPQAPDSTALLLCEKLGSFCPEFNLSWLWLSLCLTPDLLASLVHRMPGQGGLQNPSLLLCSWVPLVWKEREPAEG